ncbi:MAG: hypothetical protein IJN97_05155 [Oscillospiraceae bacterium]|nr:hypothetical protein [Oscillospiraceae bacterium]
MTLLNLLTISVGGVLAQNLVFTHLLGTPAFLRDTKDIKGALKHGIAVGCFIPFFSILAYIFDRLVFTPLSLGYMRTFLFAILLCGGMKICEAVLKTRFPALYEHFGISFDEVCFSSVFLGAMLICVSSGYSFFGAFFFGVFSGAGYILASVVFAAVRENLEYTVCPKWLEGTPVLFITLGLIALAFMGFSGIKFI